MFKNKSGKKFAPWIDNKSFQEIAKAFRAWRNWALFQNPSQSKEGF